MSTRLQNKRKVMSEEQKVYIRGAATEEDGKRVIAELVKRGGKNPIGFRGVGSCQLYYIDDKGIILHCNLGFDGLRKASYKEIKLENGTRS